MQHKRNQFNTEISNMIEINVVRLLSAYYLFI